MSKKDNKFLLEYFLIFIFFYSCSDSNKSNIYTKKSFQSYSKVHKTINDSLNTYIDSSLDDFTFIYNNKWEIDSMICINSKSDKLFTTINVSSGVGNTGTSDASNELLGKKINGNWYFFPGGGTLIIPRDMYGKDEMHPLTFYELSQIARKNMMESALVKKDGEYVVSDEWIDKKFYSTGYGLFKTRAEYDSIHWMLILRKWTEKIDTNEYKPLKKKEAAPIN